MKKSYTNRKDTIKKTKQKVHNQKTTKSSTGFLQQKQASEFLKRERKKKKLRKKARHLLAGGNEIQTNPLQQKKRQANSSTAESPDARQNTKIAFFDHITIKD